MKYKLNFFIGMALSTLFSIHSFASDLELAKQENRIRYRILRKDYYAAQSNQDLFKGIREDFEALLNRPQIDTETKGKVLYALARMDYYAEGIDNPNYPLAYARLTEASKLELGFKERHTILNGLSLMESKRKGVEKVDYTKTLRNLDEVWQNPEVEADSKTQAIFLWDKVYNQYSLEQESRYKTERQDLTHIIKNHDSTLEGAQAILDLAWMDYKGEAIPEHDYTKARKGFEAVLNHGKASQSQKVTARAQLLWMKYALQGFINPYPRAYKELEKLLKSSHLLPETRSNIYLCLALISEEEKDFEDAKMKIEMAVEAAVDSDTKLASQFKAAKLAYKQFDNLNYEEILKRFKAISDCWSIEYRRYVIQSRGHLVGLYQLAHNSTSNIMISRRYCALIIDDPIFMSTKDNELLALRIKAQARLALMNFKGLGLDRPNFKDAFEGFQKVCNNSFSSNLSRAQAYYCIAYMNLFGKGTELNRMKAKIGFQLVLNFPDIPSDLQADAHYWLGFMIYKKMETSLGDPSARTRFKSVIKLAPKNSLWANAHYILGEMDFKKGRDERDPEALKEARQHFILARPCLKERNQLRADYTLALMDWLGYGIEEPNLQDAYEGFKKVAEQSDLDPELASKAERYLQQINSL